MTFAHGSHTLGPIRKEIRERVKLVDRVTSLHFIEGKQRPGLGSQLMAK